MEKFAPGSLSLFGMLPQVMYVLADAWTSPFTFSHFYRQRHYSIFNFIEGRSLGTHFVDLRHRSMINFLEGNTWLKLFVLVTSLYGAIH